MKKVYLLFICLVFISSCNDDLVMERNDILSTNNIEISIHDSLLMNKDLVLKKDFAKALSKVFNESLMARNLIKNEALKMIDNDYDVLYQLVKDEMLEDNITFEQYIGKYIEMDKLLSINEKFPTLTIFVPELPKNSFSAALWNTDKEIPVVAVRTCISNDVPIYDKDGEEKIIKSDLIPMYPIVVLKDNERIVANEYSNLSRSNFSSTNFTFSSKSGITYSFLGESFNNMKQKNILRPRNVNKSMKDRLQKSVDAYNIYKNKDGWHRDYIYYDMVPGSDKGVFVYDYKETLYSFQMKGDPNIAFQKISDQTGDAQLDYDQIFNPRQSYKATPWTDGKFDFLVKVYVGTKSPIGTEQTFSFGVKPEDLFRVSYKDIGGGNSKVDGVKECLVVPLDLPLFEWNIENFSCVIKISIEEIDGTETQRTLSQTTAEFAGNFELNPVKGVFEKVGLKFGASAKKTITTTFEKTFTLGNDELGDVIVNFYDPVVLSGDWIEYAGRRDTAYSIPLNSKYYNGYYKIELAPLKMY